MAMQAVKDHINSTLYVGTRGGPKGVIFRPALPEENLSTLKFYQMHNKGNDGEVVYVGKTSLLMTGRGYLVFLHEFDMSKVDVNKDELPPNLMKDFEREVASKKKQ
jgi:hypothetical protein